jgi:hypothetical protein
LLSSSDAPTNSPVFCARYQLRAFAPLLRAQENPLNDPDLKEMLKEAQEMEKEAKELQKQNPT